MVLTTTAACLTNIEFYVMGGQGVELELHAFVTLAPCGGERSPDSAPSQPETQSSRSIEHFVRTDSGSLGLRRRWLEIAVGCVMQTSIKERH